MTKLTIGVIACLLVGASATHAQLATTSQARAKISNSRPSVSRFKLVPTVGISSGAYDVEDSNSSRWAVSYRNSSNVVGMNFGLLTEFKTGWMSYQTGLLYLQEGSKVKYYSYDYSNVMSSMTEDNEYTARLDYIGIPLLAKVNFPPRETSVRFTMKGGLIPTVLVASKIEGESRTEVNGKVTVDSASSTDKNGIRSMNLLANLGIGVEFPMGSQDLRLETQYTRGLLTIGESSDSKDYTQSVMLNIGMGFSL